MPADAAPSPLSVAALALIGDGVTAPELVTRFAASGPIVDEAAAERRLGELGRLGLARAVPGTAGEARYVVTPLGQRLLGVAIGGTRDQAELLAEIEQMRTDLLSTIAHELRTPLTAVRTSVGLLLDPAVAPTAAQHRTLLESIDRNATRMQRVVGDILELSRFRAGRVQLQLRRFDAVGLAKSAISSVTPLAESRHQRIELRAPDAAIPVFGDHRRLEQALVNLLSNAGKYSPDGAPIHVSVARADPEVCWTVEDQGIGIAAEDQARLFERFFVADRDGSAAGAGIGLGLPISLLIVEAHGGRIEVESEPGRGSTFRIVVPEAGPRDGTQG
jgi:signal transduction histidine kinase